MLSLFRDGGLEHRAVHLHRGERSGLSFAIAIHSLGADGIALGGCRLVAYATLADAVGDALRLSHSMSYKAAAVGLRHGGAKCVIAAPRGDLDAARRHELMHDVGDVVQALGGSFRTGKDAGTTAADFVAMAQRTDYVIGLPPEHGGTGDPSAITAFGVVTAIEAACQEAFGTPALDGRSIAVLGLGTVGAEVAREAARRGARLVVADVDERRRALAEELGARWVSPAELLSEAVDVVAPCALGGILTSEVVAALRCGVVAGAANNQLAARIVAEQLEARGIVWAPDFVANAGGLIGVAAEVDGYDADETRRRTAAIGDALTEIFARAREQRTTSLAAAEAFAAERTAALVADRSDARAAGGADRG